MDALTRWDAAEAARLADADAYKQVQMGVAKAVKCATGNCYAQPIPRCPAEVGLVDLRSLEGLAGWTCVMPPGSHVGSFTARHGVWAVASAPGALFAPGATSVAQQAYWLLRATRAYCEPPHPRNVDGPASASATRSRIWDAALHDARAQAAAGDSAAFPSAYQHLAWATLGYAYDWTARRYVVPRAHMALVASSSTAADGWIASGAIREPEAAHAEPCMPRDLAQWCQDGVQLFGQAAARAIGVEPGAEPAVPSWTTFCAETAIVNFSKPGSVMGGHRDMSELTMDMPVFSASFGCAGVFLLGGATRAVRPLPVLLRSGDVMILSGPARTAYHGVAAVVPSSGPEVDTVYVNPCSAGLDTCESSAGTHRPAASPLKQVGGSLYEPHTIGPVSAEDASLLALLAKNMRVNINVRQVIPRAAQRVLPVEDMPASCAGHA